MTQICGWAGCPWLTKRNFVYCCVQNIQHLITITIFKHGSIYFLCANVKLPFVLPHCSFKSLNPMSRESRHPPTKPKPVLSKHLGPHFLCLLCFFLSLLCCVIITLSHRCGLFSLSEHPSRLKTSSNKLCRGLALDFFFHFNVYCPPYFGSRSSVHLF